MQVLMLCLESWGLPRGCLKSPRQPATQIPPVLLRFGIWGFQGFRVLAYVEGFGFKVDVYQAVGRWGYTNRLVAEFHAGCRGFALVSAVITILNISGSISWLSLTT